jgi:chromatin modification-related protein VID21
MFILLQRRNNVELVLTVESQNDAALRAFMDRFDISKACGYSFLSARSAHLVLFSSQGTGSIAQLADNEFAPSPPSLSSPRVSPISDIGHDSPSVPPAVSPMSEALTSPSPPPLDTDMNVDSSAPAEHHSPSISGSSHAPSPDLSMEVSEELSLEVPDEEPQPPSVEDTDLPVEAPTNPPDASPEDLSADAGADTSQPEILSEPFEDSEDTMDSLAPSEVGPAPLAVESDGESAPEALASPVVSEEVAVEEDMDVDILEESHREVDEPSLDAPENGHSEAPLTPSPSASQTEIRPSPSPSPPVAFVPVVALPPSAFMLPPDPSTEVFIPVNLAPVGEPPQYVLDLTTVEPRSLTVNEWLNPEFSLNRNFTLPPVKSLPLDQQRRLKLGKSQRKKDKEKDRLPEGRKGGTDDWMPLGINKWGATIKANPLWKRVSRATKTLSTRDWNVSVLFSAIPATPDQHLGGL